ncbi:tRNA (N6-threonylcarbamoyladenosine(37)-N6)-methyltransferase TrmO [Thiothrix lacustris]|uniref:tRNA (N6-threonylcarbamoyladenosine(37)-N6)-methyltransferase TrmO n=1 Tax=Thiothrix lacustris TaxID=525917 RepID=UPI00048E0275|nr:tRNA (N6-threonylcarbamoyladenosine(37)-N6)-methyltransferase TrmO [Thiothrix lacustris]
MSHVFKPIGTIVSPYKEKFGIPRQPGLVTEARATLTLLPPYNLPETVRGLEGFSHVWIIFVFHGTQDQGWKPTVRPPRLGGNARMGVFATRSTFRPNPIGLTVAELLGIQVQGNKISLELAGADLLDGTPVLDIKPYLPYADALTQATAGFAPAAPAVQQSVTFSSQASLQCEQKQVQWNTDVRLLVEQILSQDPRPSYQQGQQAGRVYAMRLYDFDLRWHYTAMGIEVLALADVEQHT